MCVSRILRKRIDEELDENCIIQPGRDIPKEQYVRRRAYTKQHRSIWEAAIKKYKHVKCIFQNCHFLALSVEDMISHFGYCNGDGSFAKFACPYCDGRVTSEKILQIHIRRSHEYEYGFNFLDVREDSAGSVHSENKEFGSAENEFRTLEGNLVDVKIEGMGYNYSEGVVSTDLFTAENEFSDKNLHYEGDSTCENYLGCSQEMEFEESAAPKERDADFAKQASNEEKSYRGDHIYFKRMGKLLNEGDSISLSVMKNNNLKHYSGPRNVSDKIINCKDEEWPTHDVKFNGQENAVMEKEEDLSEKRKKSGNEHEKHGKFVKQIRFPLPAVQNIRRKIHQSYTNSWNQSIKTNGFARCLMATCNFISLDIFHVQNHFKTCNGVPADGPNLCKLCSSWLPSAIELSIHWERCKSYRALTDPSHVPEGVNDSGSDFSSATSEARNSEEEKNLLDPEDCVSEVTAVTEPDPFQIGKDNKNDDTAGTVSKKEKVSTLRISDILKLKENGNMDINRIIQPGPVLPKDQYLRRRAYTKQHKAIWEAALEKHKYVKCIFQNCHFVAMSVEDMIYHFGYCIGDGSFARFECPHCEGRLTSKMVLDIHIKMSHPDMVTNEIEEDSGEMGGEYGPNVDDVLPSVEELKKLVSSREIKTYRRNPVKSKLTKSKKPDVTIKSEPFEWCENNIGPLSFVAVVLEENQTDLDGSAMDSGPTIIEADLVSNVSERATELAEEIRRENFNERHEQAKSFSGNSSTSVSGLELNAIDAISKDEKGLEKDIDKNAIVAPKRGVESQHKKSLDNQEVSSMKCGNRIKNSEDTPTEVEDSGTKEMGSHQKRSVTEGEKTSERKDQSNCQSGGGENLNGRKVEDEKSDPSPRKRSSRRGVRPCQSPDDSRRDECGVAATGSEKVCKVGVEQDQEDEKNEAASERKRSRLDLIEDEGGTKTPRRRGRPPKKASLAPEKPVKVDEPIPEPVPDIVKKGRRGRKRKNEETEKLEESTDSSEVKCAKCDFQMKKQRFSDHNFRKHVGLSWIAGETPLDTSNEEVISYCVKQAFKVVKSASCEICNCVKKSALGFISHIQNCGKSEEEKEALKVTCPYCPSRVLKYSLPMHLKLSHSDSHGQTSKKEDDVGVVTAKRISAIRAANKFQEVLKHSDDEDESKNKALYVLYEKGVSKFPKLPSKIRGLWKKMMKEKKKIPCRRGSCLVESADIQDAKRHHFTCPELPEKSYVCQLCDFYSSTEETIQEHVKIHPNLDGDFTIGSEEEKMEEEMELNDAVDAADHVRNKSRLPENPNDALEAMYKMKFFVRENLVNGRQTRFCRQSLRMMLNNELEETEDATLPLPELRTSTEDWIAVSPKDAHNHLPSQQESMSFSATQNDKTNAATWRKLGRFEGEILESVPVVFTGGSVLSMSWCKNSSVRSFKQNPRQYLAVSSSKDMRTLYDIHEVPEDLSGCIQIWDCGQLKSTPEAPKFVIGIIHDSGQVWDLSWFPIDTYEGSVDVGGTSRIGLLGAACQDGTVRIWSVCDPEGLKNKFGLPLFRTEPRVTLQLEGSEAVGCLRLTIGKKGIIAGGFANGMIAIWNVKAVTSPFCKKMGKTFILKPHLSFQAHKTSITALSICPKSDRYIATSGMDRFLRLWDLECVVSPIESTLREVCLDNAWSHHWPLTISTFEDVIPCTGKGMVKAFRDAYCDKHRAPLTIDGTCWSLSVNDWMNIICGCNNRGEVKIRYLRNMFMADEKFRLRTGHLFQTTDLRLLSVIESEIGSNKGETSTKKNSKSASAFPRTYEEARQYFGLVFNDFTIRDNAKQKSETKTKKGDQCIEEYPVTSINKVCWNPNYGSFKFLAVGHQSGFVRIRQLEDIRCEEEVQRFLREAEGIIAKKETEFFSARQKMADL